MKPSTPAGPVSADNFRADLLWLDGKLIPWEDGRFHLLTHALHYGLGVFEGIRAYKTKDGRLAVFRLKEHIHRLFDSAHIALLRIPYSESDLIEGCLDLLRQQRNRFTEGAYLRPIAFMGEGAMGLGAINPVRVGIAAWSWGVYMGEKGMREGIRVKVSSYRRQQANGSLVRAKITGQYVNSILAKREALLEGYDEALLLDASGCVAEASAENIFLVDTSGTVHTPSLSSPILSGITRNTAIRLLRDAGNQVEEGTFTRDALYVADEAFLTGTAAEITPIREVDRRPVGLSVPGPMTQVVQEAFFRAVRGQDARYSEWLSYV